jgi:hypothetical protein
VPHDRASRTMPLESATDGALVNSYICKAAYDSRTQDENGQFF